MTRTASLVLAFLAAVALVICAAASVPASVSEGAATLLGQVTDVEGRPVEGARVFVYSSSEIRRSADYISPPTDRDGRYRIEMRPGTFWSIARLKKNEDYGPLMPGDKHSGDPVEITLSAGKEVIQDFTIADLRDVRKKRNKEHEGPVKITGRIVDETGAAVQGTYAFANRKQTLSGIPDYLSAGTDRAGHFTLYVPRGTYFLGSAIAVPPGKSAVILREQIVDKDLSDVVLVRRSTEVPEKQMKNDAACQDCD